MGKLQNTLMGFITIIIFSFLNSCGKNKGCYNEQMYLEHKDDICTMDCPGVKGCDGENYCNECIANAKGIAVIK